MEGQHLVFHVPMNQLFNVGRKGDPLRIRLFLGSLFEFLWHVQQSLSGLLRFFHARSQWFLPFATYSPVPSSRKSFPVSRLKAVCSVVAA